MFKKYIGTKDFYQKLMRIALPLALSNLLSSCMSIVDSIMVASIGMVTAVGNAGNVMMLNDGILWGVISGIGIFSAQFYGAKQYENMNKTFDSAMTAITRIEDVMKKNKKSRRHGSALVLLLVALLMMPAASYAVTKQNADTEYRKGNYQQAIKDYQELLQKGVSVELYYNLGNAYYRSDNITQAVLAYERAHMLSPGDKDINFNLQFARSKTIDKITPESEMFFVTWYHSLVNFTSVDNWATVAIVSIILVLALLLVYLFVPVMWMKKAGFFGAFVFLVLFLLSNLFAYQQKEELENRKGAIVIAPSVSVKKTPVKSGADQFVIHEGTRVNITDKSIKEWRGIRLDDGREGWIQTKQIEEI